MKRKFTLIELLSSCIVATNYPNNHLANKSNQTNKSAVPLKSSSCKLTYNIYSYFSNYNCSKSST